MNNNTALDYIDRALRLAKKRHLRISQVKGGEELEPMYNSFIAHQMRKGLKVRLPHEVEPDYQEKQRTLRLKCPNDFNY